MATVNPIASGDASPRAAEVAREYRTTGEELCRLMRAPKVAARHFNDAAPASSLLALAIARTSGAIGISEVVLELSLPTNATLALEAARDAIEEVQLILNELQRRDGLQYSEVPR